MIRKFRPAHLILATFVYAIGGWAVSPAAMAQNADRPNIVVFLVDDMGVMDTSVPFLTDDTGAAKRYPLNDYYRTPGMQRLASQGIRFNNFYAMTSAAAMSEAFAMADKAGVSRQSLYDVLAAGPNHSGMMDFIKAYAVDGDPQKLAFALRNALKDVSYYAQMARDAGGISVMSGGTKLLLQLAEGAGQGDRLVPEMVDVITGLTAKRD